MTCKGKESDLKDFSEAIKFLINKYLLTNLTEKGDIMLSVKKKYETNRIKHSIISTAYKTPRNPLLARSEKQSEYIKALKENDIIMSLGPAGTGKVFWLFQLL